MQARKVISTISARRTWRDFSNIVSDSRPWVRNHLDGVVAHQPVRARRGRGIWLEDRVDRLRAQPEAEQTRSQWMGHAIGAGLRASRSAVMTISRTRLFQECLRSLERYSIMPIIRSSRIGRWARPARRVHRIPAIRSPASALIDRAQRGRENLVDQSRRGRRGHGSSPRSGGLRQEPRSDRTGFNRNFEIGARSLVQMEGESHGRFPHVRRC